MNRKVVLGVGFVALALLAVGQYLGLFVTPPEAMMGDVYRIIYVHVPCALMALLSLTLCFVASVSYLLTNRWGFDALAEACAEVGVFFATLLLLSGAIWGKPTWGVYWTWDPRLTTSAILWLASLGYLALRKFVDAPERRATWAAVVAIIVSVDVPIVYYSVRWWNSLHQLQSTADTVAPAMRTVLRINITAMFVTCLFFIYLRYKLARKAQAQELLAPPELAPARSAS